MERDYDVIIIGTGIGGLTVANYLARAGVKTAIFEKNKEVGGYLRSFERQGYTFDAGPTCFGSNGIVRPIIEELNLTSEIDLLPVKRRIITDNFNCRVDGTLDPLEESLLKHYPTEQESLQQYFTLIDNISTGLTELFGSQILLELGKKPLRELIELALKEIPFFKEVLKLRHQTNHNLHSHLFSNRELMEQLDRIGYPTMSALYLAGMWYSFQKDYWYPKEGMGDFSAVMARNYKEWGGHLYLDSPVNEIIIEDNTVKGIRMGEQQFVANSVVSNIDLKTTYLELIDDKWVKNKFADKLREGRPSKSMFILYLGLSGKGFDQSPYLSEASHNSICLKRDGCYRDLSINITSLENPDLSPDGEVVTVWTFDEYNNWKESIYNSEGYSQQKQARTKEVLDSIREIIPDLDVRLEVVEAATPLTLNHYTGASGGATGGWSWDPTYQLRFNWFLEGKIKGLYRSGQWLYNPGGVPTAMLTGRVTAQQIIEGSHQTF